VLNTSDETQRLANDSQEAAMSTASTAPLALVTGAARGIGAEVARQLAAAGYHVIVAARDRERAEAHANDLRSDGLTATAVQLDIADQASVDALAAKLGDQALDVLVNNAAAFADWSETASSADLESAAAVVSTNLFGTWRVIQSVLPALRRAQSARIVNVGSGSGSHGDPQFGLPTNPVSASYAISKAAVHALTAKLAVELQPEGIIVNAVDPGLTATAPGMEAMGARPIPDGAASVVWAATLGPDAPTGGFYRDGASLAW
jgi:NAD(P)-dependent dehydrogenase (short-subunit alcohol dehydrogenase family)